MQTQSNGAERRPAVNTESSDESHSSTQLSLEEFALALQDDLALLDAEGFGVLKDCMDDFLKLMNACANKAVLGQIRAIRSYPADDDGLIAVLGELGGRPGRPLRRSWISVSVSWTCCSAQSSRHSLQKPHAPRACRKESRLRCGSGVSVSTARQGLTFSQALPLFRSTSDTALTRARSSPTRSHDPLVPVRAVRHPCRR